MNVGFLKIILKGIRDSWRGKSFNPFNFQLATSRPVGDYSDYYLVCKIKHEAHLLEKATKNPYQSGRAETRHVYLKNLLKEISRRDLPYKNIVEWAESISDKYQIWKEDKVSQHLEGDVEFSSFPDLSVSSIRFWKEGIPSQETILECIRSAQLAPASCNRQAFLIKVERNTCPGEGDTGANNASMFNAAPYRVFIFINMFNYSEKYSSFIDLGMFAQNFILEAKKQGLGCCCCYASEHLETGQDYLRKRYGLSSEYYCGLSILAGYPLELAHKPPRVEAELITEFRDK